ncbi:diacylglycerol/lipid kinase family protein [Actinoplanes sp. NPDC051494]|uniref:diacylglycerol/lipid kinase family protein n=1 Tax=Actinoplanes sp. NPDC051494 TaxID=3363907 RepID=UPI0037A84015
MGDPSVDDIAVLANPRAGRGRHRGLLPAVLDALATSGRPVRLLTASTGAEAEQACHRAVAEGVSALITIGGDGTVHRALQAVAGTGVPLGVIPAGTGNDFAAAANLPPPPPSRPRGADGTEPVAEPVAEPGAGDPLRPRGVGGAGESGDFLPSSGAGGAEVGARGFPGPRWVGGAEAQGLPGPGWAEGFFRGGRGAVGAGRARGPADGPGSGGGRHAGGRRGSGGARGAGGAAPGVPETALRAAEAIAGALRSGRDHPVDLARVTGAEGGVRWFGTVLAAGFDAVVNERANRMRWPRGPRRYDLAIVLELARLRSRHYRLVLDGVDHRFDGVLVAVGNGPSYGGGMRICPDADLCDGMLDVVTGGPMGRGALARLKPRLRQGTHVRDPRVGVHRAREVVIEADGIAGYADGERIGPLPLRIGCEPGAVRLLR